MSRSHRIAAAGVVYLFVINRKTTPSALSADALRYFSCSRGPLLAVMQGGDYAPLRFIMNSTGSGGLHFLHSKKWGIGGQTLFLSRDAEGADHGIEYRLVAAVFGFGGNLSDVEQSYVID